MKTTNKYGFVSGGWIFDYMDRKALYAMNCAVKETRDKNFYTASAKIKFLNQLCDTKDITLNIGVFIKDRRRILVVVSMWKVRGEIIAKAEFLFVEAKQNKCEIKGNKNDKRH